MSLPFSVFSVCFLGASGQRKGISASLDDHQKPSHASVQDSSFQKDKKPQAVIIQNRKGLALVTEGPALATAVSIPELQSLEMLQMGLPLPPARLGRDHTSRWEVWALLSLLLGLGTVPR